MTENKDFKRLVRARMDRTGEAYTAARAVLIERGETGLPQDLGEAAGISEASVLKATGKTWTAWTEALDEIDAIELSHREIAKHVNDHYSEVTPWWAQSVTVGYERIRGLRDIGQRRSGSYDVNKSKTVAVPISKLYGAFTIDRQRQQWLPGANVELRTSTEDRSIRWTWMDGTTVSCWFTAKGDAKSTVQIQHGGLDSREAADELRVFWTGRLAELVSHLGK